MKKIVLGIIAVLMVCGLLAGAYILGTKNTNNNVINEEKNIENDYIKSKYIEILDNKISFTGIDHYKTATENINLDTFIRQVIKDDNVKISYVVMDLDNNSKSELVINLNEINENYDLGTIIIYNHENNLYARYFKENEFSDLKTDGTYSSFTLYSGGFGHGLIAKASIEGKELKHIALESREFDLNTTEGSNLHEEYKKIEERHKQKEDVKFTYYNEIKILDDKEIDTKKIEQLFIKEKLKAELPGEGGIQEVKANVKILDNKEKKNLIESNNTYKETDILAQVEYSFKPKGNPSAWITGNQVVDGDWVKGNQCVILRNDELIIVGTSF